MKIIISGANGLIGSCLREYFKKQNHQVVSLLRNSKDSNASAHWNPATGEIETNQLEGCDVVIHLAGASIASPWSKHYKKVLYTSRIESTKLLSQTLAQLKQKPKLLISASAIGYYGNHPSDVKLDESHLPGNDFLAELCQNWEAQTKFAQEAGIRVVCLRTGIVLDKRGGALAKMLPAFRLGLGGVLGHGQQMMSWIALAEIPYIIEHIIQVKSLTGPINMVAPQAVTNKIFTKALGNVINRPVVFPVPSFVIQTLLGEMGQTLLLEGSWVVPKKLLQSGYQFRYDEISLGLTAALK